MKRMRFSIAGLMGFVVVFALGFAALKAADETWSSVCYTLVLTAMIVAILNAVQSRGKARAYWVGFAVAGSAYAGLVFGTIGPFRVTPPRLLTESLFDRLEAAINPNTVYFALGRTTITPMPPVSVATPPMSPGPVPVATPPAPVAPVKPATPPTAVVTLPTPLFMPTAIMPRVYFMQIAHSLTALLLGLLGGIYSAWLFGRRERREAGVSPSSP